MGGNYQRCDKWWSIMDYKTFNAHITMRAYPNKSMVYILRVIQINLLPL